MGPLPYYYYYYYSYYCYYYSIFKAPHTRNICPLSQIILLFINHYPRTASANFAHYYSYFLNYHTPTASAYFPYYYSYFLTIMHLKWLSTSPITILILKPSQNCSVCQLPLSLLLFLKHHPPALSAHRFHDKAACSLPYYYS